MTDRNEKGQFIKGESGNPGGRPVAEFSITTLIDKAVTKSDWLFIFEVLRKKARRGELKAIELLLDRRFGKANQPLSGDVGGTFVVKVLKNISLDEL